MGKDLKGKELGVGICQLKDGRYMARYTNRYGKRMSLYSWNLKEVRTKLTKAKYEDELGRPELILELSSQMQRYIKINFKRR